MAGAGAGSARGCSSRGIPPRGPAPPTIIPTTAGSITGEDRSYAGKAAFIKSIADESP
jgi:hypothetical protein